MYEKQLRGFERITITPGETKTVKFISKHDDLKLLDKNINWVVEPGTFEIVIGSSVEEIRAKKIIINR